MAYGLMSEPGDEGVELITIMWSMEVAVENFGSICPIHGRCRGQKGVLGASLILQ